MLSVVACVLTCLSWQELQHTVDMVQDLKHMTNFQYLKHVVLKFMLSREPEVTFAPIGVKLR